MHSVPGVLHTRTTVEAGQPKLWFNAVESEVRALGLTLSDLAGQLQASSEGHVGGFVLEDITQMPVRIRLGNADRGSLEHFGSFRFMPRAKEGQGLDWVPAETLGRFEMRPEAGVITRRDGERVNKVLGYTDPGVLPIEVTRAVLQRLNEQGFELAPGYRLEIAGDSEEQGRAVGQLATYLPVLALLMVATLVLTFSSFALGALIALVAVLSVGLGMLALWLSGHPLGFNPLIGSAGLVGVAINGSIVVLAAIRANPLARAGEADAVAEVTVGATRHIVATTLTTTGGFLPLILGGGAFWPPLAVVIAGGVALSTVLALLLTPAAYRLLARAQMRRELPRGGQSIAGNGSDKRGCVPPVPIDRAA